ncbi:MAG: hypothetical protein M1814_003765 [Vezdaea aestivalis]|nr:MAG: hypothetical protein M1814_003765 [Vezdaea aestivalis]
MGTPRVFIARHGETEWSLNGRHTGTTELSLTENGQRRVQATGRALVGDDRLIVPAKLAYIYVSPRERAQKTLELLGLGCRVKYPWKDTREPSADAEVRTEAKIEITQDIREWDYGDYEGLTSAQIRAQRKETLGSEHWDIWSDGCPGGESPVDVTERLDRVIANMRERFHKDPLSQSSKKRSGQHDVLVVAHGHILRAFAMRWAGKSLSEGPTFLLEAGGIGTLSYEHDKIDEPAILLGGGFIVGHV